ncbi:hypothetical protein CN404_09660 [Bacillus thuringiensis]|uniref:hypothetical protein n=1 Tax=Bacillus thuringiensis TaxID=1428 RepID=UPI000BF37994|nr:hypothetical protein [Bacillus thuringiensis]PFB54404.1 hypothetical protein CN404_09660 [Bacillus thuringiensis]
MNENSNDKEKFVTIQQWNQLLKEIQTLKMMFNYQTLNSSSNSFETKNNNITIHDLYYQILTLEQELIILKKLTLKISE